MTLRDRNRLTQVGLKKLARTPGAHHDGGGLYLIVRDGACNWVYRYSRGGDKAAGRKSTARTMGLGPYPDCGLAAAREKAAACRRLLHEQGLDPLEQRRAERQAKSAKTITFAECVAQFLADHRAGWHNEKHKWQWARTLDQYASPVLGALPVAAIDTAAVRKVLSPIWEDIPETAGRLRGRIEKILDWAKVMGYRSGDNPAAWKGNLQSLLPARAKVQQVQHHAALPYPELPAFLAELSRRNGVGARALAFAIYTAARVGEVTGARWREFDLDNRMWLVPAERMKMRRPHRVPLSSAAMAILAARQVLGAPPDGIVFPGAGIGKPMSNMTMIRVLKRMGRDDLTVHGFRSTFRDWCAECTTYPSEVAEMALAHAVGDKTEAAYRRGDLFERRRALAEEWAGYCAGSSAPQGVPRPPSKAAPAEREADFGPSGSAGTAGEIPPQE